MSITLFIRKSFNVKKIYKCNGRNHKSIELLITTKNFFVYFLHIVYFHIPNTTKLLQMRMKKIFLLITVCLFFTVSALSQQKVKKTVLQAFWWNYWNTNYQYDWADYLADLAPRIKAAGFDAIWIPPIIKNANPGSVGYEPFDNYDLGDKFQKGGSQGVITNIVRNTTRVGTKDAVLRMIAVMHANGIEVIEDIVLQHNGDAGTNLGLQGGQDTDPNYSMVTNNGYKNFRYVSYKSPLIDESQNDYYTRSGRWALNYENFFPNLNNNHYSTNNYDVQWFGPAVDYDASAYGQSSNIPSGGTASFKGGTIIRNYYNPAQSSNYMYNNSANWMLWLKKQTGADGFRLDAAKNYYTAPQQNMINAVKYNAGFANGGEKMFCVGEYVDNASNLDSYVNSVKLSGGEMAIGTFDFSYRAYGTGGGVYGLVSGGGSFDMQSLPGTQQSARYYDYVDGTRVHRTVPFVNSHDTFRPLVDGTPVGNYPQALGNSSGWDNSNELSAHIDPRDPRLAAAYAAITAIDGSPMYFFEDLFDVGTTGKRWSHLPTSATDLPIRGDITNILLCHQKLGFKNGDYGVSTALTGSNAPYYAQGNSGDHLVIERNATAIIGISDYYNAVSNNASDEQVWVTTNFSVGTVLYDYSGAHGTTSSVVQGPSGGSGNRVLIATSPNGHTISGAYGHGYSVWAPYPSGTPSSVNDLYNYLATYNQSLGTSTTQEWEMADDLGDSHNSSLGQGGALPANSTNQRVAGKIFVASGSSITYKVSPQTDNTNITAALWDLDGNKLSEISGNTTAASPITGNYTALADQWITIKVHNTNTSQPGQECWVNVTYTAPTVANTLSASNAVVTRAAIWTGNKGTTNIADSSNWEEGILPSSSVNLVIPANASPAPIINSSISIKNLILESNATATINSGVTLTINGSINNNSTGNFSASGANIILSGSSAQSIPANLFSSNTIKNLTINNNSGVTLNGSLLVTGTVTPTAGSFNTNGYLTLVSTASSTASVAQGSSSGGYLTGNTIMQRYIGTNYAWRTIGFPFTHATNINGASGGNTSLSNYVTTPAKAYWYDETADDLSNYGVGGSVNAGWKSFISSTSISSSNGILILGDVSPVTLSLTGPINTGDQTIALSKSKNGWNLLSNPFASNISWTAITGNGANTTGLGSSTATVYRMKPIGNNSYAYSTYNSTGSATNGGDNVIENGAGFFVQANAAANLTIRESDKTSSNPAVSLFGFQPSTPNENIIKLSLSSSQNNFSDEVIMRWGMYPATENFDLAYDAYDLGTTGLQDLSVIGNDGTRYAVFHGAALQTSDKENRQYKLGLRGLSNGNYLINAITLAPITDGNQISLIDNYTHQNTLITDSTAYDFSVTDDSLSKADGRFSVVFNSKTFSTINNSLANTILIKNPTHDNYFTIKAGNNFNQLNWQLNDASGRCIQKGVLSNLTKGQIKEVNTATLTSGIYFIKINGDNKEVKTYKWIKQ